MNDWYYDVADEAQQDATDRERSMREDGGDPEDLGVEEPRPITIMDLAIYRGAREVDGAISAEEFVRVGLAMIGGCASCAATIGAHNACPSKSGVWLCTDCVGDDGWASTSNADREIFGAKEAPNAAPRIELTPHMIEAMLAASDLEAATGSTAADMVEGGWLYQEAMVAIAVAFGERLRAERTGDGIPSSSQYVSDVPGQTRMS